MTSPFAAVSIKEQDTETNINANVWIDDERIAVLHTAGNIVGHITAIDHVEINLEIFIGRKIILEKHSKRDEPVSRPAKPATGYLGAVNRLIEGIKSILGVVIIFYIFFCSHNTEADPAFGIFHQLSE